MCLKQNCHSSSLMTIFTSHLLSYSKSSKYDVLFYKSYMPWHSFAAKIPIIVLFFMVQQPLMGQGLLIIEASWLQSNTHTTLSRTPPDKWSSWHRDLYLTTDNTHNRKISMSPVGFEPIISAGERPQDHALDRAANGIGVDIPGDRLLGRKMLGW